MSAREAVAEALDAIPADFRPAQLVNLDRADAVLSLLRSRPDLVAEITGDPAKYECPRCFRVAPWTDGRTVKAGGAADEFWCQACGTETPILDCRVFTGDPMAEVVERLEWELSGLEVKEVYAKPSDARQIRLRAGGVSHALAIVKDIAREAQRADQPPVCHCHACNPAEHGFRMFLCETCGNKRCPHATHHGNDCTGSNESGQVGSRYPAREAQRADQ